MKIDKNTTNTALNESFIGVFPYLKLGFYKKPHDHFHGSKKKDEISGKVGLGILNPDMKEGIVEWKGEMSVDALETYLEEVFGLHVQVFRKSGDIWLQTSVTDHWTLNEQNSHAADNEQYASK